MTEGEKMDVYLRAVREKMSELAVISLKLEYDIKLAIILNGLPEQYRHLVVSLEKQEKIDFDEPMARLLEEELKVGPTATGTMALVAKKVYKDLEDECHYCSQKGHWRNDCHVRKYREGKAKSENDKRPVKYSM
jgi:gag-polypeptide of LTR copia-type